MTRVRPEAEVLEPLSPDTLDEDSPRGRSQDRWRRRLVVSGCLVAELATEQPKVMQFLLWDEGQEWCKVDQNLMRLSRP